MLFFNTWGILNTFGVYQTYYEKRAPCGQKTSSNISWIGSIQALMVLMVGAFTGPIYDRGYLRPLLLVGSFFIVFGHMMLSLTHTFWQALLAQGFVIGIGGGLLFRPRPVRDHANVLFNKNRARHRSRSFRQFHGPVSSTLSCSSACFGSLDTPGQSASSDSLRLQPS